MSTEHAGKPDADPLVSLILTTGSGAVYTLKGTVAGTQSVLTGINDTNFAQPINLLGNMLLYRTQGDQNGLTTIIGTDVTSVTWGEGGALVI